MTEPPLTKALPKCDMEAGSMTDDWVGGFSKSAGGATPNGRNQLDLWVTVKEKGKEQGKRHSGWRDPFLCCQMCRDVVSGLGQSPFGTLLWEYDQDRREAPHVTSASAGGNYNSRQSRGPQDVFKGRFPKLKIMWTLLLKVTHGSDMCEIAPAPMTAVISAR